MLLLPVTFCTPIHKHECDLNIERGKGANVTLIDRPFLSKTLNYVNIYTNIYGLNMKLKLIIINMTKVGIKMSL